MKSFILAIISGGLFGAGLTVSTMVDPERVIQFLDIFGQWDPTLMFVMGGGLFVYLPTYFVLIHPRKTTLFNTACDIPRGKQIDRKLIVGAIFFGVGWGLSGICPGPALANLSSGVDTILIFVATMVIGMFAGANIKKAM